MKLKNISVAIMVALGVAACGGSDNNNQPAPVDPPQPPQKDLQPTPEPTPETSKNDEKIVDPTGTKVVDGRDLTKESTVGGLQYIRREASDYDRVFNPDKPASATPLLGVSLDEQNPKLTNIVLARRDLEREDEKAVRAQFAGGLDTEPLTPEGKPQEKVSLQAENFKNVDILAGAFKQVGSAQFNDPDDDRLDPTSHDINTHIQNNVDKDREFTRERVEFVYTPRFEYRQPFVDYPNATDANKRNESDNDTALTATAGVETQPIAPGLPGASPTDTSVLQSELINDGDWTTKPENINSRHPVNTGTNADKASGFFVNNEQLYGNRTYPDTPQYMANASAWRNKGTVKFDGTAISPNVSPYTPVERSVNTDGSIYYDPATTKEDNAVDWSNGAFKGAVSRQTYLNIAGTKPPGSLDDDTRTGKDYNYQQKWPKGAYPDYPEEMFGYPFSGYKEDRNNTLTGGIDGDPKQHEHIYLEREKFTAIREPKSIRPLVNPVANEWSWKLRQEWATYYNIYATVSWQGYDHNGNLYTWYSHYSFVTPSPDIDRGDGDVYHNTVAGKASRGDAYTGAGCTAPGGSLGVSCVYQGINRTVLQWAHWHTPTNEGKGQRGEFRGPAYTGWDQDNRTIQFADTRIWKPGTLGYRPEYERKYGANLIWWSTQDSAFENWATSKGLDPRARRVDRNVSTEGGEGSEDLVWGNNADGMLASGTDARDRDVEIQPTGDITNGLIRVGGDKYSHTGKMATLGQELIWKDGRWEDHHKTTTRIFGHYHLAWADQDDGRAVKAMSMNSYSGARSFVAKVKDTVPNAQSGYQSPWGGVPNLDSEPLKYSIGAEPMTLQKVQYGRVTSNLDLVSGEGPLGDGFLRAPFAKKGEGDSVDNYFFRGVDATSIEQMDALPKQGAVKYVGHALMYGINNDFHGITGNTHAVEPKKDLPNAFNGLGRTPSGGGTAEIGLGNFVEADVDFGARKVKGDVYNTWLVTDDKPTVVHDKLVAFEGDITGNTVLGTADRTYVPGDDKADFRAAFFGKEADEMGGSFNSVKPDDKYGSAYETGDWGGVFGAKKLGSSNTFQGDDGANVYGN